METSSSNQPTDSPHPLNDPIDVELHADALDAATGEAVPSQRETNSGSASNIELQHRLDEAEKEALRSRAELENARKRLQRDAEQQVRYANLPLVRDLLDAMDNLNRAVEAAKTDAGNAQVLLDGVKLVSRQFADVLAKYACKPIESAGKPFDPNYHEAIAQMPSPTVPSGCVAQEVAIGYMLHDRVIRPSQVIVSTGPAA